MKNVPTVEAVKDFLNRFSERMPVVVATTANITLSGLQTIDGIPVIANDRVLVKNQTAPAQNGIYIVNSGAWVRTVDADHPSELAGASVAVKKGTLNGGKVFLCKFKETLIIGVDPVTWVDLENSAKFGDAELTTDEQMPVVNDTLVPTLKVTKMYSDLRTRDFQRVINHNFALRNNGWVLGNGSSIRRQGFFLRLNSGAPLSSQTPVGVTPGTPSALIAAFNKNSMVFTEVIFSIQFYDAGNAPLTPLTVTFTPADPASYIVKDTVSTVPAGAVTARGIITVNGYVSGNARVGLFWGHGVISNWDFSEGSADWGTVTDHEFLFDSALAYIGNNGSRESEYSLVLSSGTAGTKTTSSVRSRIAQGYNYLFSFRAKSIGPSPGMEAAVEWYANATGGSPLRTDTTSFSIGDWSTRRIQVAPPPGANFAVMRVSMSDSAPGMWVVGEMLSRQLLGINEIDPNEVPTMWVNWRNYVENNLVLGSDGMPYKAVQPSLNQNPVLDEDQIYWELAGGGGQGGTVAKGIAGEDLPALIAVYVDPATGKIFKADRSSDFDKNRVLGITTKPALTNGTVFVQAYGVIKGYVGLTPNEPVFLGNNGGLYFGEPSIPTGDYRVYLGVTISATEIFAMVSEPTQMIESTSLTLGVGEVMLIPAGSPVPETHVRMDGLEISRSRYNYLWDLWEDEFGPGDGVLTFNIPDWTAIEPVDENGDSVAFWCVRAYPITTVSILQITPKDHMINGGTGAYSVTPNVANIIVNTTDVFTVDIPRDTFGAGRVLQIILNVNRAFPTVRLMENGVFVTNLSINPAGTYQTGDFCLIVSPTIPTGTWNATIYNSMTRAYVEFLASNSIPPSADINNATTEFDFSNGYLVFDKIVTANQTWTFTNPIKNMQALIRVQHDSAARTVTFPSARWVSEDSASTKAYVLNAGTGKFTHFYVSYDGSRYFISDVPYWLT